MPGILSPDEPARGQRLTGDVQPFTRYDRANGLIAIQKPHWDRASGSFPDSMRARPKGGT